MEKIKQLALHWQLLILLLVAGLVYYGFYAMITSGIYTEAAQVREQAAGLQAKNEQARIATQNIEQFRQLFAAKTSEYDELKVLLPEQREITNVLQGLQDTARVSNLTTLRFSPRDDKIDGFITGKPVEIEVSSNFNNLKTFYEQMAKLPRIVSITDFKISQRQKQASDKTIDSQFLLTAYYATPESVRIQLEKEKAEKEAKNPKPAAKPAAPAGQNAPAGAPPAAK